MVVGARDGDDLGDAERRQVLAVGTFELCGVVDAADADDDALAGHQPRHALHRADRARVGERDVGALEVVDGELVGLDLADDLLVGGEELGEVHLAGVLDDRYDQRPRAVTLVDVDREAHVDGVVDDEARLAVGALRGAVPHRRHRIGDRSHDGVADDVGEADLAHAGAGAVAVDHVAVDLEQLGRDVAEAGGRRHGETALHVGGDRRRSTLEWIEAPSAPGSTAVCGGRRRRWLAAGEGSGGGRGGARQARRGRRCGLQATRVHSADGAGGREWPVRHATTAGGGRRAAGARRRRRRRIAATTRSRNRGRPDTGSSISSTSQELAPKLLPVRRRCHVVQGSGVHNVRARRRRDASRGVRRISVIGDRSRTENEFVGPLR